MWWAGKFLSYPSFCTGLRSPLVYILYTFVGMSVRLLFWLIYLVHLPIKEKVFGAIVCSQNFVSLLGKQHGEES